MSKKRTKATPVSWYEGMNVPMVAIRRFARSVARRFRPDKIILFGSHAYGKPHEDSDVDLLVEFEHGQKTFDNFMQLAFLLEEILQRRVDLLTPEALSPYIGPYILDEVEYAPLAA